jgi:hypothetical protein
MHSHTGGLVCRQEIEMKAKLICTAILALSASFNAAAQDAAADVNDAAVLRRAMESDATAVKASEAAFARSLYVFEQRRLLNAQPARVARADF